MPCPCTLTCALRSVTRATCAPSRALADFTVKHFAGDVRYACAQFLEKNNDSLDSSFKEMLLGSSNEVVKQLAQIADEREKAAAASAKPGARSAAFASVSKRFVDDINALLTALNQTSAHFVRCMKPNGRFRKLDFDSAMIMGQLKCNGTLEAVQLMRHGYPNRVPYDLMFDRYKKHLISVPGVAQLTPAQFCEVLAAIAELQPSDYQLGVSKMFLRAGKGKFLEDLKEKPIDEVLPVLKAKLGEWERKKRAVPLIAKFLHMQLKRVAYRRLRRSTVWVQSRRRGTLARREYAIKLAAHRANKSGQRRKGAQSAEGAELAKQAARAEADAIEYAEVQAEVAREMGLDDKAAESLATARRLGGGKTPRPSGGAPATPESARAAGRGVELVEPGAGLHGPLERTWAPGPATEK